MWNGRRWKTITPESYDLEEIELVENYNERVEAAEGWDVFDLGADEILTESTPLLSTAATTPFISGAAAAAAPTTSAIAAGVAVGAGTILAGGAVLVGHTFLGPGNDENNPALPTDIDDRIARTHDLNYATAISQPEVLQADELAVSEFASDFSNTGNIHSALGAAGLGVKRTIEELVGVQYPPNLPSVSG